MNEKNELDAVVVMLTQWVTAVKLRNAVNYTDINRLAENLVLRLLNTAYDYNLKNLNWEQNNYPAVDLGDHERGIAFQVTASGDFKKIKDTVEKFYAPDGPHKEFPNGLYFFFIREKAPTLSSETKQKLKTKYGFDGDRQMLSIKELLMRMEELYSMDRERFRRVKDLLEEEWGYESGKINRRKVLEELYRGSKRYLASLRGGGGRFRYLKISDILLAPTRKSQRKEWLDTPVIVDGKEDEIEINGNVSTSVLEAIPRLWQEECKHAMLKGEGGMGKTVSFIRLWEQYTASDEYNPLLPVPVFIPLNEYNETVESGRRGFIQRLIRRFYLDKKTREEELPDVFREPVKGEKSGLPSVILLLDGLNEVTVERTGLIVELREMIEHWQGVQMLISSRPDMRDTMGWTDFHLLELRGLSNEQIDKYLRQWGLSPLTKDGDESECPLLRLLQNPMMLTIYTASCEVVKKYGASSLYDFKKRVEMSGELLWNFMEAQVVKYFRPSGLEDRQKYFYKFLLKMLLPALGYEMEKAGRFQLAGNELDVIVERYLKRFCQADFLDTFRDYRRFACAWDISNCSEISLKGKLEEVLEVLTDEMSMLVKEGHSYRFLHQDFRDFFAAVHILNGITIDLAKKEIPGVLKERTLPVYLIRFVGEIEGEHYSKPFFIKGKGWAIKENTESKFTQVLKLCRNRFDGSVGYGVWNIVEIWKENRGELSGADLMHLDLSMLTLNRVRCNRFYGEQYLSASFDGSLLHLGNIFPDGHASSVNSAVYSIDGKKILTASGDRTIREWDESTGRCLKTFCGHKDAVYRAIYNCDGKKILSVAKDDSIREWDVNSGKCLKSFEEHMHRYFAVYSPEGNKIISAARYITFAELDSSTGHCLKTFVGHFDFVNSAIYRYDGKKIISASCDKTIKEWDVASGENVRTFKGHVHAVNNVVYSPDRHKILSASRDGTIKEWNISTGKCLRTFHGHEKSVNSAVYNSDGTKLLSASADQTIKEWDTNTGQCQRTFRGHNSMVNSAIYSNDGKKILSASLDRSFKEWDVATGQCLKTFEGYNLYTASAVYIADEEKIYSAHSDSTIREWDVASGKCIKIFIGHKDAVNSVVYNPGKGKILSASVDRTIKEWGLNTGICLNTLFGHEESVENAVYSSDGQKILSFSYKTVREWDITTGKCLNRIEFREEYIISAVYSSDEKSIITYSSEYTLKEWDVNTGKCTKTNKKSQQIKDYSISHKIFDIILSRDLEKSSEFFNRIDGLNGFRKNSYEQNSYSISPDRRKIVLAWEDATIEEWDLETKSLIKVLKGHNGSVNRVVYNDDGEKILSASRDETIKEWDVLTGECLRTFEMHGYFREGFECASYSADRKRIFAVLSSGIIIELDIEKGKRLVPNPKITFINNKIQTICGNGKNKKFLDMGYTDCLIKEKDSDKIIKRLQDEPGLFIQGCSFKNLHPLSNLTKKHKARLAIYGAVVELN